MNEPKRNRNSLLGAVFLAFVAGGLGLYWFEQSKKQPAQSAVEAPSGYRDLAKGALAAFLVKSERPQVADLTFRDKAGAARQLSQWRGRVVLLNLWATWCAPCRTEMPALAELQKQLGSEDFEVVALSIDRKGLEASADFLAETGAANLGLYIDETTRSLTSLQAMGLPVTVLIDRNGREIGRLLGPAEWSSSEAQALIKRAIAEKT